MTQGEPALLNFDDLLLQFACCLLLFGLRDNFLRQQVEQATLLGWIYEFVAALYYNSRSMNGYEESINDSGRIGSYITGANLLRRFLLQHPLEKLRVTIARHRPRKVS